MEKKHYCIAYWTYEIEKGGHIFADDHYEEFGSLEEAEKALSEYQEIDEEAHILEW